MRDRVRENLDRRGQTCCAAKRVYVIKRGQGKAYAGIQNALLYAENCNMVLNNLDRYQLALDAIMRIPRLHGAVEAAAARYWTTMERHLFYIGEHGEDMPEVRDWRWAR
jgi:phosphoketolase